MTLVVWLPSVDTVTPPPPSTASQTDGVHAALARGPPYTLHACGLHSPPVGLQPVIVCMLVVRSCMCVCVCVFAATPQYKRGHRKTASFGTILDVPKIVVTGITGPPGFLVTGFRAGLVVAALTWPLVCVTPDTSYRMNVNS